MGVDSRPTCTNPPNRPKTHSIRMDDPPTVPLLAPTAAGAVLWILARLVYFRIHLRRRLFPIDSADYVRRARWKAYHTRHRQKKCGKISGCTVIATLPPGHALNDKTAPPQRQTKYRREKTLVLTIHNTGQIYPNCKTNPINVRSTTCKDVCIDTLHY
jgi:hypothetical protein